MRLQMKDWDGALVAGMDDDSKMLGYYSPEDGWTIHINDVDANSASAGGWLERVDLVKKYEMSDEEYQSREGTYRSWKMEQLRKNPKWTVEQHMAEKRGEVWVGPRQRQQHGAATLSSLSSSVLLSLSPSVLTYFSPALSLCGLGSSSSSTSWIEVASITLPATCHAVTWLRIDQPALRPGAQGGDHGRGAHGGGGGGGEGGRARVGEPRR